MRVLQPSLARERSARSIAVAVVLAAGTAPIDAAAVVTCKYAGSVSYAGLTGTCKQYNCSNGTSYHNWVNSSYYQPGNTSGPCALTGIFQPPRPGLPGLFRSFGISLQGGVVHATETLADEFIESLAADAGTLATQLEMIEALSAQNAALAQELEDLAAGICPGTP